MSTMIADWKSGARKRLRWIDFERYARRVFAGSADDWYRNPVRFAGTLGQALRVIRSDVVAVDAMTPFLDHLGQDKADAGDAGSASSGQIADLLQTASAPQQFLSDVADALAHSIGDKADLVLTLRSPRDLLLELGASDEEASDFDALDAIGTAQVALIRSLSTKSFQGLQILSSSPLGLSPDEVDAYEPIMRTAEYYGWARVLCHTNALPGVAAGLGSDIVLFSNASLGKLLEVDGEQLGGGLTSDYWKGSDAPSFGDLRIIHGIVPVDANPESVVEKMTALANAI